jgi:sporulation protein YlmC with PRC-barrel domain
MLPRLPATMRPPSLLEPENPMKKELLTIAVATALGVLAVPRPQFLHAQEVKLVVVDVHAVAEGYRTSKLLGRNVVNDKNEKIGTLDDLVIGHDEPRVLFSILQVGGFLGLGGHLVAVPYESLKLDIPNNKITLSGASKDELRKMPEFRYPES